LFRDSVHGEAPLGEIKRLTNRKRARHRRLLLCVSGGRLGETLGDRFEQLRCQRLRPIDIVAYRQAGCQCARLVAAYGQSGFDLTPFPGDNARLSRIQPPPCLTL